MTAAVVDQPAYSAMVVIITLVGGRRMRKARVGHQGSTVVLVPAQEEMG